MKINIVESQLSLTQLNQPNFIKFGMHINHEHIFSSMMSKNFISCQQLLNSCQSLPSKPPKQDSLPRLISTKTKVWINLASKLST